MAEAQTPAPWFDWKNREWLHEPQRLLAHQKDACVIAASPETLDALIAILPIAERWLMNRPEHPDNAKIAAARMAIGRSVS